VVAAHHPLSGQCVYVAANGLRRLAESLGQVLDGHIALGTNQVLDLFAPLRRLVGSDFR
jgi:hypothetical protein